MIGPARRAILEQIIRSTPIVVKRPRGEEGRRIDTERSDRKDKETINKERTRKSPKQTAADQRFVKESSSSSSSSTSDDDQVVSQRNATTAVQVPSSNKCSTTTTHQVPMQHRTMPDIVLEPPNAAGGTGTRTSTPERNGTVDAMSPTGAQAIPANPPTAPTVPTAPPAAAPRTFGTTVNLPRRQRPGWEHPGRVAPTLWAQASGTANSESTFRPSWGTQGPGTDSEDRDASSVDGVKQHVPKPKPKAKNQSRQRSSRRMLSPIREVGQRDLGELLSSPRSPGAVAVPITVPVVEISENGSGDEAT